MLCRIAAKYGREICRDARRCEGLLNDLCGAYRREINVLVNAVEERVPLDLLAGKGSVPPELLLTRLEKRLEEQTALTGEAARWAVESWALALNVATNIEIEAREKRTKSAPPFPDSGTVQPNNPSGSGKVQNINRGSATTQPPKIPPTALPTRNNSPVVRQPAQMPRPAPPVNFPKINQPVNQPPVQRQPINPPAVPRKSFGLFRGCLLVIFLLAVASVVLFFGVPYAIETMRQTQQERSNEPPRFPVR